ncbi:MAG: hypothetical protein J6X85_01700 [Ruminococcus sp.]|nr:hypothetical protein [Ruminococcus sp.]
MNNSKFDLKRKLAFVAALAFTANSAYSVPAAGADQPPAVVSVEPDPPVAPDGGSPPVNDDGQTRGGNADDLSENNNNDGNQEVTYNLIINGITLDEALFSDIASKIFVSEGIKIDFDDATGSGTVIVNSGCTINREKIFNVNGDVRFDLASEENGTFIYDTYYKVEGFGGDDRISLKNKVNGELRDISDSFCMSGTNLELIPSDYYVIDNGSAPVTVHVNAPMSIKQDNFYGDDYQLIIGRDRHTVSPRKFSVTIPDKGYEILLDKNHTDDTEFYWRDVDRISVKAEGMQSVNIACDDYSETIEISHGSFECSVLNLSDQFRYRHNANFVIAGVDEKITAYAYFDEEFGDNYRAYTVPVIVKKDASGYTVSVPYLAGDGYCLSSYTYAGKNNPCKGEDYENIVNGERIKVIDYDKDADPTIKLVYKKLADSDNVYVFQPEADLYKRNDNCYAITSTDASIDFMEFTSLFDGSTILYDVFKNGSIKDIEHKKFVIGEDSRTFTDSITESQKSALYIVKNIVSKSGADSFSNGLDGVICFYKDRTAPDVVFTSDVNSEEWVGKDGMSFAMKITDNEECPVAEGDDLSFDEGEIIDIYKNFINKETADSSEIYSVVVGDYRFDRPAKGWGDTANIKGYVETPDMRKKYDAAVALLSKLKLSDIKSSYSDQLNYDSYYRKLLREHSETLIKDITGYFNDKIDAENEKETPDEKKVKGFDDQCKMYVNAIKAYSEAQSKPERTSECVPVLTYNKDTKEFSVSVKAESAYADNMVDEWLNVFAFDDCTNSSWDESNKKQVRVRIDGAPPVVQDNKINITNDTVIKESNGADVHVIKAGSAISVMVSDIEDSVPGSGVSDVKISLSGDDDIDSAVSMEKQNGMYIFNIVSDAIKDVNIKSFITIYALDSVGNPAVIKSTDSKYGGFGIIIDNAAPTCSLKNASDLTKRYVAENDGGKEWYGAYSDVKIAVAAEDPNPDVCSGIKELKFDINGHSRTVELNAESNIDRAALAKGGYYLGFEGASDPDRFKVKLVNTATGASDEIGEFRRHDGGIKVKLSTVDYAGNHSSECEYEVWIDLAVPVVENVWAGNTDLKRDERYGYVYFAREQAEARVYVKSNGPSAGMDHINADLVNSDGTPSSIKPVVKREGESDNWTVTVPDRFKGYIRVKAFSRIGRDSAAFETSLILVENSGDHSENADVSLELPATNYKDINGLPLYRDDIDAKLTVKENFSGISKVYISSGGVSDRYLYINASGQLSGDEAEAWSVDENSRDFNLVNEIQRDIKLTGNSNNSSTYVNFADRAGNPEDEIYDRKAYSIDKTDPVMNVSFTDANGSADSEFKQIFKNSRRAVITINERNFDKSLADIRVNDSRRELDWRLISGTAGTDSATYQAEIPFENDGTYRLTASFKDLCGREAKPYDSKEFVIDRTAPSMNIGFDKTIANDHYYNEPTTATFRISDQNFDPSRVVMTGTYNDSAEDFPKASAWTKSGSDYVSTVRFEKDGEYTVNITGKDMAGNTLEAYNAKFCIDSQSPKISVSDVKPSNNKNEIRPHIQFKDVNLDKDSIDIKLEGANRGKSLKVEGELRESDDGYEYVFNNIPDEADYDDIYTITASAKDNAANKMETDFRFSVNRYGSTFLLDEGTGSIVGRYISRPQDIVISEVNADKHSEPYSVYITKDSEMAVLKDNVDYKVEYKGGDDEWSEYKYIIYARNFEKDGRYTVSIHSVDEAGNINVSTSEKKNSYLEFCVDTTEPLCIPLNVSANSAYKGERLDAKLSVSDNIMLKGAKVFLNNKEIRSRYIDDEYLEFIVPNSKHSQDIRVVLTDMAGNEKEYSYKNVLVSTNAIRILAHKTWFKFVCGGVALLGGAAAFLIRRRRKKLW